MKRAIGYCLPASKRFGADPTILIVCIEPVEDSVKAIFKKCDNLPCYTVSCDLWADQCYVSDKNSTQAYTKDYELDPFVAFEFLSQFAEYNKQQKRKLDELVTEDDLEEYQNAGRSKNQRADEDEQATTSDYEARMKFVEKFKRDRAEEDKAMSWELCLLEGREKLKWNYKNSNSLRAAFAKYEKKKQ
ncbi:hypothetical protein VKS41_008895 [Umbelopsis sp. WA50703]